MTLREAEKKIARQAALKSLNKKIDDGLNKQHKLVMTWTLHLKHGFGAKRALEQLIEYENTWACVNAKDMTDLKLDDIEACVLSEMDLYIHENGNIYHVGKGKGKDFVKDNVINKKELFAFLKIKEVKYEI